MPSLAGARFPSPLLRASLAALLRAMGFDPVEGTGPTKPQARANDAQHPEMLLICKRTRSGNGLERGPMREGGPDVGSLASPRRRLRSRWQATANFSLKSNWRATERRRNVADGLSAAARHCIDFRARPLSRWARLRVKRGCPASGIHVTPLQRKVRTNMWSEVLATGLPRRGLETQPPPAPGLRYDSNQATQRPPIKISNLNGAVVVAT